jgi:hypothetical protein
MIHQANTLRSVIEKGNAWEVLATQHPSRLADMVDRLSQTTGVNREHAIEEVITLLQRYGNEWTLESVKQVFGHEIEDIRRVPKRKKQSNPVSHEGLPK